MPTGRRPKPPGQAITRHRRVHDWLEVDAIPFAGRPLPKRPGGGRWPSGVLAKWRAWSTMPHCAHWGEGDWSYAADSLLVAARFYEHEGAALAAELRIREAAMGCTWASRQSLRLRYVAPPDDSVSGGAVAQLDDQGGWSARILPYPQVKGWS
jgi:hypothetical protein